MLTIFNRFHFRVLDITVAVGRMTNASTQHVLVQGDTGPKLRILLQDSDGNPINVSGMAVHLYLRPVHADGHINVGHEACSGVDPVNGVVVYDFQPGDLVSGGTYFSDVQILYDNGHVETGFDACRFLVRPNNQ